jgi:hypothetical protein
VSSPRSSHAPGNEEIFEAIVQRGEYELALGSSVSAAAFAQLAADVASTTCSRLTRSTRLEQLLFELAIRLPDPLAMPEAHQPNAVLHVLTDSSPSNPRASLLAQWLETDTDHQHAVTLTHAADLEGRLARVVDNTTSRVVPPAVTAITLPSRAAGLRVLARGYAATLLHTAPFDIVPALAFGSGDHGPLALVEAGLDRFRTDRWITNLLLVASARVQRANRELHRIQPERFAILPSPIPAERRKHLRRDARRSLNVSEDSMAILVFANLNEAEASSVISKVKSAISNTEFLVVSDSQATSQIEAEGHARRIHLRDTSGPGLWDAVDVVLDLSRWLPTPLVLRAANRGLPVVVYRPDDEELEEALQQHEELRTVLFTARSDRELSAALDELRDPASRNRSGAALQAIVRGTHSGAGWRDAWARVWDRLLATEGRGSILSDNENGDVTGLWFEPVLQSHGFRSCIERQNDLLHVSFSTRHHPPDDISGQAIDWMIELAGSRTSLDPAKASAKLLDLECELSAARKELELLGARLADLQSKHSVLRAGVDGILASGSYRLAQGIAVIANPTKRHESRD